MVCHAASVMQLSFLLTSSRGATGSQSKCLSLGITLVEKNVVACLCVCQLLAAVIAGHSVRTLHSKTLGTRPKPHSQYCQVINSDSDAPKPPGRRGVDWQLSADGIDSTAPRGSL